MNKLFLAMGILVTLGLLDPLVAQDSQGSVTTSPKVPDDPNLAKVAMLRLWYIGGPSAPRICLAKGSVKGKAEFMESGLAAGTVSPYVPLRPGEFKLHILDGTLVKPAKAEDELPVDEKKIAEPVEVHMRGGTYYTLVIREQNGRISTQIIEDERPAETVAPILRIKNFSDGDGWSVWLLNLADPNDKSEIKLWKSGDLESNLGNLPPRSIYYFDIRRQMGPEVKHVSTVEVKLLRGSALSLLLFDSGYGVGQTRSIFDAVPGAYYSAAQVQAVASGASEDRH